VERALEAALRYRSAPVAELIIDMTAWHATITRAD